MTQLADATLSSGVSAIRFLFTVLSVCVLAILATKLLGKKLTSRTAGTYMQVIETVTIAPNRSLCLAYVAGRVLLLGISENGISRLARIDDLDLAGGPTVAEQTTQLPAGRFFDRLVDVLARGSGAARKNDFKYLGRLR